jgi:hypothetical protein
MTTVKTAGEGFRQLTSTYHVGTEYRMLKNVVSDLERGKIEFLLVEESRGHVSVWRAGWIEMPDQTISVVKVKATRA